MADAQVWYCIRQKVSVANNRKYEIGQLRNPEPLAATATSNWPGARPNQLAKCFTGFI